MFFKINFFKKFFQERYQSVRQFEFKIRTDFLGPNCLQKLSADQKI